MSSFKLQIKGWEDGERVDKILEKPDRWQLHSADQVRLGQAEWARPVPQAVRQQHVVCKQRLRSVCLKSLLNSWYGI